MRMLLTAAPSETPAATAAPTPTASAPPEKSINFAALKAENEEIVAWIEIPETKVDYPVVQGKDNIFYLDHDALRQKNVEGAIFVDCDNTPGFADRNTVLYGHRMNNGNMFAGLHDFEDADFFAAHNLLLLYTPDGTMEYEIFAAYKTGDEHILSTWEFSNDTQWNIYVEEMLARRNDGNVRAVDVVQDDTILTLSTCVRGEDESRYLVQAVLRPSGVRRVVDHGKEDMRS